MDAPAVLLIEDSADDAKFIADAIAGVVPRERLQVCASGEEALDFIYCRGAYGGRSAAALPLLVILDLGLPKLDGLEVLREIRGNPATRLLPVTLLSGSNSQGDVVKAAELGANSFVRKVPNLQQMSGQLRQLVGYWLELNIPPPARARQ